MLLKHLLNLLLILSFSLLGCQTTEFGGVASSASSVPDIDRDVTLALNKLYSGHPAARSLAQRAPGILVFPDIVKGGFMFGAQYGTGALLKGGRTVITIVLPYKGPGIVVVDDGMGKSLTTTTGQADVYAFIFNQKGLMAGVGLQGSKIIKINLERTT